MPEISVIIPAYNAEETILKTVASVEQQTFADFELIIIDDESSDRTLELLETIKDNRVQIYSDKNGGTSVARNRGIARATGEYVTFLDADDLWTADKLERQLAAFKQHPEAGVTYSWTYFWFAEKERIYPSQTDEHEGNVYAELLISNFLHSGSNPLIRREAIESVGLFDPTIQLVEDWDYWLRLAAHWPFVLVRKLQIYYRQHSGSKSNSLEKLEDNVFALLDKAFKEAPDELQSLKPHSLAVNYRYLAQKSLNDSSSLREINRAGQKLWQAICCYPQILQDEYTHRLISWLVKKRLLQLVNR
ncbi:MAG: glycosyltransferase family 2 protein [Cyanophyceae cyanobacterium]